MQFFVNRIFCLALLVTTMHVHASDSSHIQAAEEFFTLTISIEQEQLIHQSVDEMLRRNPGDRKFANEYEDFFRKIFSSPEYKASKIRAYVETFSETELRQLSDLARQPAYKLFTQKLVDLTKANRKALTETIGPRVQEFSAHIERLKGQPAK